MDRNAIGDQGENCAALRLGMFGIFRCYTIGGKAPAFDILIEIIDDTKPYQALIQVKSTNNPKPYDANGNLKTPVPDNKLQDLISRPLPTYAAGVCLDTEVVHIAPAFNRNIKLPTIPPILILSIANTLVTEQNLLKLKEDIINYWESNNMHINKPSYQTIL